MDEPASIFRPERVSAWELEPLVAAAAPTNLQPTQRNKRARPPVLPSATPDLSVLGMDAFFDLFIISLGIFFTVFALSWCFNSESLYFCALGMWKSSVESPSGFPYCDPHRGRDLYPSPKFSSITKTNSFSFSGNSSPAAVSSNSMYWSNRMETATESFAPAVNKESGEKRRDAGSGCRLFGFQLLDNSTVEETLPVLTVGEDQPVPSLDVESDQHSEPSNINRSDIPSVSCEPDKLSLRSPQESQSRQIRSCTKVF